MSILADLTARVAKLESQINNIVQPAKVIAVDADTNLLNLEVRGVELLNVPYQTPRAGTNGKTYWVPEVGEVGLLQCPGGDVGNAIFQPALNTEATPAPDMDINVVKRIFKETIEEVFNGNDDQYMLRIGGDATRITEKDPAKIEDAAHASKLTLEEGTAKLEASGQAKLEIQQSGTAELAATMMAKLVLNAIAGNLMGANLFPSGITTFMSPVGPCLFAPAPPPSAPPSPPAGSAPDSDGNVTQTPPSIISGITWQNGTLSLTIPSLIVTGVAGTVPVTGTTAPLLVSLPVTGSGITLQFPSQSL